MPEFEKKQSIKYAVQDGRYEVRIDQTDRDGELYSAEFQILEHGNPIASAQGRTYKTSQATGLQLEFDVTLFFPAVSKIEMPKIKMAEVVDILRHEGEVFAPTRD